MNAGENVSYRPEGSHDLTVYLTVPDVRKMIDFYVAAFGAEELVVVDAAESVTYHGEIRLGDTIVYVRGDLPGIGRARPPLTLGGTTATFMLWTPDVDSAFERAVAAGATVDEPPDDAYWGDRTARVTDPAGHGWTLATHRDVPPEQRRRAQLDFAGPRGRPHGEISLSTPQRMWSLGDYPAVARHLVPITVELLDAVGVKPGDRVLDVGVGDGNVVLEAARRGAVATGVDLLPEMIKLTQRRSVAAGLSVALQVADAERLPFADESFDTVASVMAVIFARNHERAARELARVCVRGGTVAITAWASDWYRQWIERIAWMLPTTAVVAAQPDEWGTPDELTRRLGAVGLTPRVKTRWLDWRFGSTRAAADFFLTAAGPFMALQLDAQAAGHTAEEFHQAFVESLDASNEATDGTCWLRARYLLAVCRRA